MDPIENLVTQLRRLGMPEEALTSIGAAQSLEEAADMAVSLGAPPDVVQGIVAGAVAVDEQGVPTTQAPLLQPPVSQFPTVSDAFAVEGFDPTLAALLGPVDEVEEQPFIGLSGFGAPNPAGVPSPTGAVVPSAVEFGQVITPGQDAVRDYTRLAKGPLVVRPQYRAGDEFEAFQGLAPEAVAGIQVQLLEAGMVSVGDFAPGFWDPASATAMQEVMGYSNLTGRTYQESLQFLTEVHQARLATDPEASQRGTQATGGRVFRLPDMASINQRVKQEFKRELGRDPSAAELALFANQMLADSRASISQQMQDFTNDQGQLEQTDEELVFDLIGRTELSPQDLQDLERVAKANLGGVDVETDERPLTMRGGAFPTRNPDFGEATVTPRPAEGETDVDVLARSERGRRLLAALGVSPEGPSIFDREESAGGGDRVITAIDPEARFLEAFERAFGGEIQRTERVGETAANHATLMRSILGLDRAFG